MLLPKNGVWRLVALVSLFSLSGCRASQPPPIPICILDGLGGADCVLEDGKRVYKAPSELKNFWSTTQDGMARFSAWCYNTDIEAVTKEMAEFEKRASAP